MGRSSNGKRNILWGWPYHAGVAQFWTSFVKVFVIVIKIMLERIHVHLDTNCI